MERRTFITAIAVTPIAGVATAKEVDPIIGYYKKWKQASKDWAEAACKEGAENSDTPECLEASTRERSLQELICETVATTPEGVAAQLKMALKDWDYCIVGNIRENLDHKLFANAILGLKGMA